MQIAIIAFVILTHICNCYLHHRLSTNKNLLKLHSWHSLVETNDDLDTCVENVAKRVSDSDELINCDVAVVFASSIYEQSSTLSLSIIDQKLRNAIPNLKIVIGCTTSTLIGQSNPYDQPIEIENKAGVSVLLMSCGSKISANVKRLESNEIKAYCEDQMTIPSINKDSVCFIFAADERDSKVAKFATKLSLQSSNIFGAVASSVTSLQVPKLFVSSDLDFAKYSTGLIILSLDGDIAVKTVQSRCRIFITNFIFP